MSKKKTPQKFTKTKLLKDQLPKGSKKPKVEKPKVEKPPKAAPTRGQKFATTIKEKLGKASGETKERIVSLVKKVVKKEDETKERRSYWKDRVAQLRVAHKEIIEEPFNDTEREDATLVVNWRDRVITSHQELEESRAGRDNEMKDLNGDLRALKKQVREDVQNMNQLGLPNVNREAEAIE